MPTPDRTARRKRASAGASYETRVLDSWDAYLKVISASPYSNWSFRGQANATFPVDSRNSKFNYLRVNPDTGEAEMRYLITFTAGDGSRHVLQGTKYMQKDEEIGRRGPQEVLDDYTTLYTHVYPEGAPQADSGTGYLKFRTFEDLAAVGHEQQARARQACAQSLVVERGHHGLARASGRDEQVAMAPLQAREFNLFEQAGLERFRADLDRTQVDARSARRSLDMLAEFIGVERTEVASVPVAVEDRSELVDDVGVARARHAHVPFEPADLGRMG